MGGKGAQSYVWAICVNQQKTLLEDTGWVQIYWKDKNKFKMMSYSYIHQLSLILLVCKFSDFYY